MTSLRLPIKITKNDIEKMQSEIYHFSNDTLRTAYGAKNLYSPFVFKATLNRNTYVDLRHYRGTDHGRYIGSSFHQLINYMKKLETNLKSLLRCSDYYFSKEEKDMLYYHINGRYYLDSEGNHRSIIAKHLFAMLRVKPYLYGVDIINYDLDTRRLYYFLALKKLLKRCYGERWKVYASSDADSVDYQYGDECRYRIVILTAWHHASRFNKVNSRHIAFDADQLSGFVFDNDNINILYQFINTKLGKAKSPGVFSPIFVLESLLSGSLSHKSSYGYQVRCNCYDDRVINSQVTKLELDPMNYLYLRHHSPIYSFFRLLCLIYRCKMYKAPITTIKKFIEYRKTKNKIVV